MSPPKAKPAKLARAKVRNREVNRFVVCGSVNGDDELLENKAELIYKRRHVNSTSLSQPVGIFTPAPCKLNEKCKKYQGSL